jgi:transposase InsO family protein
MTRRTIHRDEIDLSTWATVDVSVLAEADRTRFQRRYDAINRFVEGDTLASIRTACQIRNGQLYPLLDRCLATHSDGRLYGYRGLLPYRHQGGYTRTAPLRRATRPTPGGAAGAFGVLLDAHPTLHDWLRRKVRERVVLLEQRNVDTGLKQRLNGLGRLHAAILNECRALGLTANDYPFTTQQLAKRSLSAAFRQLLLEQFGRAARASGASHLKGMPSAAPAPAPTQAFDVVEFDGHRLDIRLKIVVTDPLGFEQQFEIERIWLLVIIDVYSRAVLGYHVSLNREYNRHDVVRTINHALTPHPHRKFTLPGLAYGNDDGFPSGKLSETVYATWSWFKLDSAKANLADDVRHALTEFMGCIVDVGPTYTPDDRPYIERIFGTIVSCLSSRLPGYTGANPRDARRLLADPKGNLRLFVSLTELEDLLEAVLAGYNATPHGGLNGRTPLEAMTHSIRNRGAWLNWLPESRRTQLYLMHTPKRARVRGYLAQGQRAHVNFYGVRYTNPTLAATAGFIGTELKLYFNSADLRTVHAVARDGTDLGLLKAQGAWGEVAHDLALRQEILRQRGRRHADRAMNGNYLETFVAAKIKAARGSRRAASSLAKTLRSLSGAPTAMSVVAQPSTPIDPPSPPPTHSVHPQPILSISRVAPLPTGRIDPQSLSIGTGFAGSFDEVLSHLERRNER